MRHTHNFALNIVIRCWIKFKTCQHGNHQCRKLLFISYNNLLLIKHRITKLEITAQGSVNNNNCYFQTRIYLGGFAPSCRTILDFEFFKIIMLKTVTTCMTNDISRKIEFSAVNKIPFRVNYLRYCMVWKRNVGCSSVGAYYITLPDPLQGKVGTPTVWATMVDAILSPRAHIAEAGGPVH